jgi:hypothetical protein
MEPVMLFNTFEILIVSNYDTYDEFEDMWEKLISDIYEYGDRSGEIPSVDLMSYSDTQAISLLIGSSIWTTDEVLTIITRLMDSKNHVDFMIL